MRVQDEQDRYYQMTVSHEDEGTWLNFDDGENNFGFFLDGCQHVLAQELLLQVGIVNGGSTGPAPCPQVSG